jgi:hypothetical protein
MRTQSDRYVTFIGKDAAVNVSIRLTDLDQDQRNRVRQMFDDGLIDDDEMFEIMRLKKPEWFPSPVDEVSLSTRYISPAQKQKLVWLGIVGPSAATSLAALLINLL